MTSSATRDAELGRASASQRVSLAAEEADGADDHTVSPIDVEDKTRRRYLLRRFWCDARGFWWQRGPSWAWVLSGLTLLTVLANLGVLYGMNIWNRALFDGLERHDTSRVFFLSLIYLPIMVISVFLSVMLVYERMTLQRSWRAWLSDYLIDRWLASGRYYHLNLVSGDHQNPEFRIADDVRVATESPVDFVVGVTSAALSAVTFIAVLWTIGGTLDLRVGAYHLSIPGFLVIAAVVYAFIASGAIMLIGHRFVLVSEMKNQSEAEYRYILTRLRENGESIALIRGEEEERAGVDRSFQKVLSAWRALCFQHMKTTIVSQGSGYIAPVLPILLCAPKYLDGSLTLGQVMQAASAFTIATPGVCACFSSRPGYRRAGRGDCGTRSFESGQAHGQNSSERGQDHADQRRTSPRIGILSRSENYLGATPWHHPARQRYSPCAQIGTEGGSVEVVRGESARAPAADAVA